MFIYVSKIEHKKVFNLTKKSLGQRTDGLKDEIRLLKVKRSSGDLLCSLSAGLFIRDVVQTLV